MKSKTPILILLAFIFCIGLVNLFKGAAMEPLPDGNTFPLGSFLSESRMASRINALPPIWQSRHLAVILSGKFFDLLNHPPYSLPMSYITYGAYYAGWVFLTFLALIFLAPIGIDSNVKLIAMLGIMAGIVVNTTPFPHPFVYPWDGPSMFCFTLASLLYLRKSYWPMVPVVIFGTLIKETNLLFCLLFLFNKKWKLSIRIIVLAATTLAGMALIHLTTPKTNFEGTSFEMSASHIMANFSIERVFKLWPYIISNAGALLLLPYAVRKTGNYQLGLVFLAFFVGQCLDLIGSGTFNELRDWYELLPISWLLLACAFTGKSDVPKIPIEAKPKTRKSAAK